ncbi:DUF4254 domain-containing protein [Granulicella sp. dw_53]|uniref:DUF4254 domain-containing protein n=1 Tax=Granulicella sp. dw_53 TaxID=2719792 RepID=UPI001BD20163|nr:DUF4254 domain-containing protein [Granulicella sp. dw_53]
MLLATSITRLHETLTIDWHEDWYETVSPPSAKPMSDDPLAPIITLITSHHRENFDLWHEEDKARDPDASDTEICCVKHAIDRFNQRRNDLVEKMDEWLLANLPEQNPLAPLNSETPGLIIDRLSILALKIFHTRIEAHRDTASEAHRLRNSIRLSLLEHQCSDLAGCLESLLNEVVNGTRRFKLYRQLKMYNDPDLNPVVYKHGHS